MREWFGRLLCRWGWHDDNVRWLGANNLVIGPTLNRATCRRCGRVDEYFDEP